MQEKSGSCKNSFCTVSVIGYSGSNTEHARVGKSCLIHRFLSRTPYNEDHLSVISRSDFDGEVVCGSHWLYWGDCNVTTSHYSGRLRIIEQCEFLDDLLYSPLSSPAPYLERCLERDITVGSRKLAYICKNQLGDESSFPRFYINAGSVHVSAFICVYDITLDGSAAFHQADFLQRTLKELSRLDIPLVLVTTKHDCSWSAIAKSLLTVSLNEKIKKRWLERRFRVVETSARSNINVEEAFHSVFLLASGKPMLKSYKSSNGCLEQRMRNLTLRLRRPLQLQYVECKASKEPAAHIPPKIRTIMIKASESYRASQFFFQLRKHDLHPSFGATSPSVRLIRDEAENHCGERTPHTVLPPPAITIQHLQCRSVPRPNLRLHTSLDDTSSVLPAPPAPLLPGPRSPGLFDPITTPSIFATATSVSNETTARTAVLVDSAATYPLTRIYLYGSEPLVNAVLWTLRSACPLDRFQAKDGSSHRVWILTGSISELEKHSLSDSDQSGEPSMSATDTTALVSGPPDCKTLGISCVSAFSTPVISIPEDAQESSYGGHGTVKSMHSSEPNSRSTQSTDLGEVNGSCALPYTQLPVQFVVRVLVYNSLDQLNDFAQTLVADVDTARLNSGQVYALLLWSASQDHSSMASLIMNGLVLTNRWQIPLLNSDHTCGQSVLNFLLDLAAKDIFPKTNRSHSGPAESSVFSIDWVSFSSIYCLPVIQRVLGPETLSSASCTNTNTIPLLAALVPIMSEVPQAVTLETDLSCIKNTPRGPLFLPSTVTAPTAVKPELSSPECSPITNSFTRFISLDQLSTILLHKTLPSELTYALVVHYLATRWCEVQTLLRENLEFLMHQISTGALSRVRLSNILLVGIHNPNSKNRIAETAIGLKSGMQYAQQLANAYNCSFRVLNPVQSAKEADDTVHTGTDTATPYSVASVDNSWVPLQLLFLSLSITNDFERGLHKKALSGDLYMMPQFPYDVHKSDMDYRALTTSSPEVTPSDSCRFTNSSLLQSSHQMPTAPRLDWSSFPPRSNTTDFPVQSHRLPPGSNFVELPWLPVSPSRGWRLSPSLSSPNADVSRKSNSCSNAITTNVASGIHRSSATVHPPRNGNPTCSVQNDEARVVPCESTLTVAHNSNELTSSVEEYYAELPKISESEVHGSECCTRRLNRPKRPRPRTSSTNSHSSSSPPSPTFPPSSVYPVVVAYRVPSSHTNRVSSSATLPCLSGSDKMSCLSQSDLLENESAVYAEVNDALLPESHCSYPSSLSRAAVDDTSLPLDPYDIPYTINNHRPCLSTARRHFSQSVHAVQSVKPSLCDVRAATCDKPAPTPAFVSRPLPTIMDFKSASSAACSSCHNHSSLINGSIRALSAQHNSSAHTFQVNQTKTFQSSDANSAQHPTPFAGEAPSSLLAPGSIIDPPVNASPKNTRPSLAAFNSLSANIRRHGVWFRHSVSWRTRKQKI